MDHMIFVDVTRCLSCRTCEIECAVAHSKSKDLLGSIDEVPHPQPRVSLDGMESLAVPIQCRHCEAAPCAVICPTGAISKRGFDGPVVINEKLCIGCRSCILVCPYGVPQSRGDGRVITKCDLCFERLERGEEPACVSGCPTGALKYRRGSQISREIEKKTTDRFAFRPSQEPVNS